MESTNKIENEFIIHSCEQVLRFTQAAQWDDLSEERKVQLGFNMGVVALGLELTKEEGFLALWAVREGTSPMKAFHDHLGSLITAHHVEVDRVKIARPF